MQFKFAGVIPLSTGCAQTEEGRERAIQKMIPKSFEPITDCTPKNEVLVLMKGPADQKEKQDFSWRSVLEWLKLFLQEHQLIVMRRRLIGYEWRIYLISKSEVLLYASTAEEYKAAQKHGYEVSVVSMGTRLAGGHAMSHPIHRPFLQYVKIVTLAQEGWNSYMEKQAARAHTY